MGWLREINFQRLLWSRLIEVQLPLPLGGGEALVARYWMEKGYAYGVTALQGVL